MKRDIGSSAISGHALPDAFLSAGAKPAQSPTRRADAARTRGEPIAASAAPYRRYLLLEVPGPWGRAPLDERHLDADVARRLTGAAAEANANILLIRRPGRQRPAAGGAGASPRTWAIADTAPEAERVLWGSWDAQDDLLSLDLTTEPPATAAASRTMPLRLFSRWPRQAHRRQ